MLITRGGDNGRPINFWNDSLTQEHFEIKSALDPEVVGEVLNVIRSLNKEHSLTMIMVTHQMGFAREISDRVCFFNEGKIFEQGPPEKLFGDPKNERTKQFLHAVLDAN